VPSFDWDGLGWDWAGVRQTAGVLDVAGGKGELAFQLVNLNNIPATVVDPRPLELKSFRSRYVLPAK
jgi:ubiquinone/menaquinone biosynthesis C-methylase UbiE